VSDGTSLLPYATLEALKLRPVLRGSLPATCTQRRILSPPGCQSIARFDGYRRTGSAVRSRDSVRPCARTHLQITFLSTATSWTTTATKAVALESRQLVEHARCSASVSDRLTARVFDQSDPPLLCRFGARPACCRNLADEAIGGCSCTVKPASFSRLFHWAADA
jgi:hypothetical protein